MSSSSNKNKKAVSFSLKTSPQAKGKPVSKPQAPVAAKNQKQPVKNAFQPKAAVKPSAQTGAVKNTSLQSKPQPQSQPKPKQAAAPVVNKIQPRPAQAAGAKPDKGSNIKNIQPVKSLPQPKPQHQQLKAQPKTSAEPKQHMQQTKNQSGQKAQQHNHLQSKQQPQKQQFQPKPPVSAQSKPQPQQKSKNTQSFTKQQPSKVNPVVELRKAAMTSDKDKVKAQAPVKHQPVHDATPLQHNQPAGVSHAADFSAETLALLFKNAKKVSENAYAPYSRFKVGAVLILEDAAGAGQISAYTGCNVENASYGLTCCAERIAIFKAVSDGNKKFKAMIIYASAKKPVSPCGACRQVIAEFAAPDMKVYSIGQFKDEDVSKTPYAVYTVAELLPHGFKASDFIEKK